MKDDGLIHPPPDDPEEEKPRKPAKKKSLAEFFDVGNSGAPMKKIGSKTKRAFELGLRRRQYWEDVKKPEWHLMNVREQAKVLGLSHQTIRNWQNSLSDDEWKKALEAARERHSHVSLQVDAAVIKKSLIGDPKAAELYYRRIENWRPTSGMELTRGGEGDVAKKEERDLLVAYLASIPKEDLKKIMEDAASVQGAGPAEPGQSFLEMTGVENAENTEEKTDAETSPAESQQAAS